MITQRELKETLIYDKETGVFTRKNGKLVGWSDKFGYLRVQIKDKYYFLHRLAWLYEFGEIPNMHIDHINNIRNDNRICNLRLATRSQNLCNVKKTKRNTSGIKNVSFHKESKKWRVVVSVNGKNKSFGLYNDIELAELVAIEAKNKFHGEFAKY